MANDKERALFLAAVQGAKPLPPTRRPPSVADRKKPAPIPVKRLEDEAAALAESQLSDFTPESLLESDESLSFTRNGVSKDSVRKMRRGHWVVQAGLDLHGMRVDEARTELTEFLRQCAQREYRCVRIIHGKGLGSANRIPVLKNKVRAWLTQRNDVLAFCSAPAHEGGAGAVLVLLRPPSRRSHPS